MQADFQALFVAVSGDVRDPVTGKYPLRNDALAAFGGVYTQAG